MINLFDKLIYESIFQLPVDGLRCSQSTVLLLCNSHDVDEKFC